MEENKVETKKERQQKVISAILDEIMGDVVIEKPQGYINTNLAVARFQVQKDIMVNTISSDIFEDIKDDRKAAYRVNLQCSSFSLTITQFTPSGDNPVVQTWVKTGGSFNNSFLLEYLESRTSIAQNNIFGYVSEWAISKNGWLVREDDKFRF